MTPEQRPQSVLTVSSVALVPCPGCQKPFPPRRPNHRYCSAKCRLVAFQQKQAGQQAERDAQIRLLLRTVIESAQEAKQLLQPAPLTPSQGDTDHDDER